MTRSGKYPYTVNSNANSFRTPLSDPHESREPNRNEIGIQATHSTEQSEPLTVRKQLQRETHHQHVTLNRHPLLADLTKPGYPLARYHRILHTYTALYRPLEAAIEAWLSSHDSQFDYQCRRKSGWLEEDIAYFGIELPSDAPSRFKPYPRHEFKNPGEVIGALYAIEGSTLGGQVISASLKTNHGLTAAQGARFFNGYADKTESRWQEFCAFSETISNSAEALEYARRTASHVFQAVQAALNCHV
jgi:heme oxygenase